MSFIVEILVMGLAMLLGAYITPGVHVDGFGSAIIAALLIALANATIGFILRIFTLPLNILTLGLCSFIITVLMILLVDSMMTSFNTSGFWSAALLAIVMAIIKMIFGGLTSSRA
ncbi:phage holin family protein [Pedobacter sp.]|uniref:phage holin family protein n=1 Tax=Pedobacter sp. TaxID=1411316 RepID=UPI003D7F263D